MAAPESFEQKQVEELFGSPDTKPSESIPFDGALPGIPTDSEPDSDTISDGNALIEAMMGGQEDPIVQAQGPEKPTPFSSVIDDQPLPLASRPPIPDEEEKANLEANRNSRDGNVRTPSPMRPEAKEVTTGLELALVQSTAAPDWLPSGWSMEIKIRTSGVTAGTRDRYFYDPVSRRRFRSKKEVLSFLETGTVVKPKSKSKKENLDANVTPGSSSSVPHKRGGSNSKRKSSLKFDTVNRPEKVRWVLTGSAEDSFKPFVGEEELPDNCDVNKPQNPILKPAVDMKELQNPIPKLGETPGEVINNKIHQFATLSLNSKRTHMKGIKGRTQAIKVLETLGRELCKKGVSLLTQ